MSLMPSNGNGIWTRLALVLVPLVLAGLIAWGSLKSDVRHLEATVTTKATREVVLAEYGAILRELQALHQRLDRIEQKVR